MVSILVFGFLLGITRFFRIETAINIVSCATILGDPNNEHRNDDFFENLIAFTSIVVVFFMAWLLFDEQFTFGQGYITQQFGLIVPEDRGFDNLGFSAANALGLFAGICLGEGIRNIIHLFEPVVENAIANDIESRNTWATLDPMTQAAAEVCALVYDLDSRTRRIALTAFSAIHQLRDDQKLSVLDLFDSRAKKFKRLPSLLKPIRDILANNRLIAVSFFEQTVKVGVASGHIDPRYMDRLKMLARALGISDDETQNIFNKNGFSAHRQQYEKAQSQQQYRSSYSHQSAKQKHHKQTNRPLNDTEKHLAVLGLKMGAGQKQIKAAYRKMAKKYHPDLLKSKNLSEAQMADAAKTMLEINAAYEWLEN